eukprot:gene15035-21105_t
MASACHALYFVNLRGDILLEKRYRDHVDREIAELFRTQILMNKDISTGSPVRSLGSYTFMYLRHQDIYMLGITRTNSNVMLCFQFMSSLVTLFKSYFSGELNEANIKKNFVLMYELLDEAMDHGLPQLTDPTVLKSLIFQKGSWTDQDFLSLLEDKKKEPAPNATLQVTGAVAWRREGLKYKRNEIYLDNVEQVNLVMSSIGEVLRSDVQGKMIYLDIIEQVNLSCRATEKCSEVTCKARWYRCQEAINVPFKVISMIKELGRTRVEYNVQLKSTFSAKMHANNVMMLLPVPDNTAKAKILVTAGKAKYDATKKALVWKIPRFMGEQELSLRAEVILVATTKEAKPWSKPPLTLNFQVPMFAASGLHVAYLQIQERKMGSAYQVEKWVRKMVRSGDCLIRT